MVEGKGGESLNNDLDFRWSHGGRQRAGKNSRKTLISDGRMVEGKGGKFK